MTITLELPPDTEARLREQAKARGLTLDAFVKTIIANQAAAPEALKPFENFPREGQKLEKAIDELFDTVQVPAGVGEGAMRRKNWYR
ncbi:MAG TPA: hypothetical protein VE621_02690 [Bryobacteraceae bacterium]|jgi:hypothetical protein|nr:hypothetical protein [Bryobacteraceae bacterium]